jgi:hypothetical protein
VAKRRKRRGKQNYNRNNKKTITPTKIIPADIDALKSWAGASSLPLGFWGGSGTGVNRNLTASKGGAAASYIEVHEVNASINAVIRGLKILPWTIKLYPDGIRKDGEEIARSNDIKTRHPFQQAIKDFRDDNGVGLLDTIAWSWLLYGEVYITKVKNQFGFRRGFDWLNPVGVNVEYLKEITSFQYGWQNQFEIFPPDEVAYWHNRHPQNDFIGLPTTVTLLSSINVIRNMLRFLNANFINDARPGAYATPSNPEKQLSVKEMELLRKSQRNEHKGTANAWRFEFFPIPMNVNTLDQPDLAKNVTLSQSEEQKLFEGFGVDRAILGNSTGSPYKDQREWFWPATVIPLGTAIEEFVNHQLIPWIDNSGDIVFEYDTSAFDQTTEGDLLELQVVDGQLRSSVITLDQAAIIQEKEVSPWMIGKVWNAATSTYMSQADYDKWNQLEFSIKESQAVAPQSFGFGSPQPSGIPTEKFPIDESLPIDNMTSDDDLFDTDESVGKSHDHHNGNDLPGYIGNLYEGDDLFPDAATVDKRITDELRQWTKFATKSWGKKNARQFEPSRLPDEIKWAVWDALDTVESKYDIDRVIMRVLDTPSLKSLASYRTNLNAASRRHWRGLSGKDEFSTRIERAIKREFPSALERGLKDFELTLDDLTKEELKVLDDFIDDEVKRIGGLSDFIQAHSQADGGLLNMVRGRVELWTNRIPELEQLGKVVGARTEKLEWVFDPRKDHCLDCRFLNGKVYRGFTWMTLRTQKNIYPRSRGLKCKGFRCGCEIKKTDKRVTPGRVPMSRLGSSKTVQKKSDEFVEEKHPRDESGQFTSGGGGTNGGSDDNGKKPDDEKDEPKLSKPSKDGESRKYDGETYNNVSPNDPKFTDDYTKQFDELAAGGKRDQAKAEAFTDYTGGKFNPINKGLRGQTIRDKDPLTKGIKQDIRRMDEVMESNPLAQDIRAYRGDAGGALPKNGKLSDNEFLSLGGITYKDEGFTSTTVSPGIIDQPYEYELLVPKGSRGTYIDSVSRFDNENEFLIGRGSEYRILETSIQDDGTRNLVVEVVQSGEPRAL